MEDKYFKLTAADRDRCLRYQIKINKSVGKIFSSAAGGEIYLIYFTEKKCCEKTDYSSCISIDGSSVQRLSLLLLKLPILPTTIVGILNRMSCYLYFSMFNIDWKCQSGSQEWRCSSKRKTFIEGDSLHLLLGGQSCGNNYGSCIDDPSNPLQKRVIIILVVVCVLSIIVASACACYCRRRRAQAQAQARWLLYRQAMLARIQSQSVYCIMSDPSYTGQPPVQEAPPPPYEQIVPRTNEN